MWDAAKCNLCGECLVRCQYVDYDKGKAAANIQSLMDGQDAEILHRCVTCCACLEYCPTGAFVRVYPDLAREVQAKNVDDAIAFGADALVTLCPMCDRVLRKPSAAKGLTKIYVTDLCRMALGEIPFPAT